MLDYLKDFQKKFNKALKAGLRIKKPFLTNYFWEFMKTGGKRWRPFLTYVTYKALGGQNNGLILKASIIPEVIHNATLVHDDIEDSSKLRRGQVCLYLKHGVPLTLNLGDWMYFLPYEVLSKLKLSDKVLKKVYGSYMQAMLRVTEGQALDIGWSETKSSKITERDYLIMVKLKTGSIARLAIELGALIAGCSNKQLKDLGAFAELIGAAFQIQDDLLDLTGSKSFGKLKCQDIVEGKRSLMVGRVLSKGNKRDVNSLIKILDKSKNSQSEINHALKILNKYDALDHARKKANQLLNQAKNKLKALPNTKWKKILEDLAEFMTQREV